MYGPIAVVCLSDGQPGGLCYAAEVVTPGSNPAAAAAGDGLQVEWVEASYAEAPQPIYAQAETILYLPERLGK